MIKRILVISVMCVLCIPVYACTGEAGDRREDVFRKLPELAEIKPEKPVRIKFKRRASGGYYWDLTGNNVEKIIKADRKLREYTETLSVDR